MNFQIYPLTVRINGQINGFECGLSIIETFGCAVEYVETFGGMTELTLNLTLFCLPKILKFPKLDSN